MCLGRVSIPCSTGITHISHRTLYNLNSPMQSHFIWFDLFVRNKLVKYYDNYIYWRFLKPYIMILCLFMNKVGQNEILPMCTSSCYLSNLHFEKLVLSFLARHLDFTCHMWIFFMLCFIMHLQYDVNIKSECQIHIHQVLRLYNIKMFKVKLTIILRYIFFIHPILQIVFWP